jgi:hypothetical protein
MRRAAKITAAVLLAALAWHLAGRAWETQRINYCRALAHQESEPYCRNPKK